VKPFLLSRASLCIRFHYSSAFFSTVHHRHFAPFIAKSFAFFSVRRTMKPFPFCCNDHLLRATNDHLHATNRRCRPTTKPSPHHEPSFAAPRTAAVDRNPCLAWKLSQLDVVDAATPPLKLFELLLALLDVLPPF